MFNCRIRLLSFLAGVAVAAACSQSAPLSPAGPSAAAPAGSDGAWTASSAGADLSFEVSAVNGNKKVSGSGTVASLTGACPDTLSMVVHGVKVVTDAQTLFFIDALGAPDIVGGCGNLRPGTKVVVEADATANTDGSFTADTITIIDQPGGKPPSPVQGDGTIGAMKGTCPTLTMVVHGYPVMTTSSTVFSGAGLADSAAACLALTSGTKIHVEGVLAGNSVVASTVAILPAVLP